MELEWEYIYQKHDTFFTYRAKVFGGWIVKDIVQSTASDNGNTPIAISTVFIPDCTHSWQVEPNL